MCLDQPIDYVKKLVTSAACDPARLVLERCSVAPDALEKRNRGLSCTVVRVIEIDVARGILDMSSEPVDHPDRETVKVRQGTGPRATVSVLFGSMVAAALAGAVIIVYFVWHG
jgi:hypothetical protein